MPWRSVDIVDQRTEFVVKSLDGNVVFSELCKEFGISRKTGYKWRERFLAEGPRGLTDQSRKPMGHAHELSEAVVCEIIRLKLKYPKWGPRKIRAVYGRVHEELPSESTFKRVLDRANLVERRKKRPARPQRLVTQEVATEPNHIWTVDFKGWWPTTSSQRCEPLTIRDDYIRYVLGIQALQTTKTEMVKQAFSQVFEQYGLPRIIRSDNGTPFASSNAPLGLSQLSVWWVVNGISLDRIEPGRPDQNGGHERMHRDIRHELQGHIEGDLIEHQAAFDVWRNQFNYERPHEALGMDVPGNVYKKSTRKYESGRLIEYPPTMIVRRVSKDGVVSIERNTVFLSGALKYNEVGLEPLRGSYNMAVWLNHLRLGEIDQYYQMNWAKG